VGADVTINRGGTAASCGCQHPGKSTTLSTARCPAMTVAAARRQALPEPLVRHISIFLIAQNYRQLYAELMQAEPGDKVRLKEGTHRGKRGVVEQVRTQSLIVRLNEGNEQVQLTASEVTNFSLAARKAWERMPDRRVGRPKGSTTSDRISVTLRIDRELWERFKRAEANGLIRDRTAVINSWIAEKLKQLDG